LCGYSQRQDLAHQVIFPLRKLSMYLYLELLHSHAFDLQMALAFLEIHVCARNIHLAPVYRVFARQQIHLPNLTHTHIHTTPCNKPRIRSSQLLSFSCCTGIYARVSRKTTRVTTRACASQRGNTNARESKEEGRGERGGVREGRRERVGERSQERVEERVTYFVIVLPWRRV